MKKTGKILSAIIALAIIVCTLFALAAPAAAATRSNGKKSVTITVRTKSNYLLPGSESVTLGQKKGTCCWTNVFTGKKHESKQYASWNVSVQATDGSHSYTAELDGGSVKLKLKPNKTYRITVTWDSSETNHRIFDKGRFTSLPTWYVKSTWKVSSCY